MSYAPIYDGIFYVAQEIHPSPIVSTDEITQSLIVQRTYGVGVSNYIPAAQGTPDPGYASTYLVNETHVGMEGPIKFFTRNFRQVPSAWNEPRTIAFTLPGKSGVITSAISSLPIGWNPYGIAAPYSQPMVATVYHSYAYVIPGLNPEAAFTIPARTFLTYDSKPVDYTGNVYASIGQATVVQGGGLPDIIENRFAYQGVVTGWSSGSDWVVSAEVKRWNGPIWELEVVKLIALVA